MELPNSITNQYARFAEKIARLRVITLKSSFIVLVIGNSGFIKVHYWIYNHGWKLER